MAQPNPPAVVSAGSTRSPTFVTYSYSCSSFGLPASLRITISDPLAHLKRSTGHPVVTGLPQGGAALAEPSVVVLKQGCSRGPVKTQVAGPHPWFLTQ